MSADVSYSLPVPPAGANALTLHFCHTFIHTFHQMRGRDDYFRIYMAIEKTAELSGHPPEVVAKALVESGLRAGRESFPGAFIAAIEKGERMPVWAAGSCGIHLRDLLHHWRGTRISASPANRRKRH